MGRDSSSTAGHAADKHRTSIKPLVLVLATIYLVFAVALANTAFVALQGRSAAHESLETSSHSVQAFGELKKQIAELRQELAAAQRGLAARSNQSSSQVQHQLQQLQHELQEQLTKPLHDTTRAAASLLERATKMGEGFSQLKQQVEAVSTNMASVSAKLAPPPVGARVEDKELHHIVTHAAVCDANGASGIKLDVTPKLVAPLVVVAHARAGYLAKTMVTLLKYWSHDPANAVKFPLFISVDGDDQRTLLLASAMSQASGAQVITRRRAGGPNCPSPDCHISQHYKVLIQLFLSCLKAPGMMFLEEDLEIAPDFFPYFEETTKLMASDPSILCVSAWNDHGQAGRAADNRALYRTDILPGLGWYLSSAIGLELAPKWPITNWDDWMRVGHVRNGRSCIFPEVSRTHTFGRIGAHAGEGFDNHLKHMLLNHEAIDWARQDLSYLLQENYEPLMTKRVENAELFNGTLAQLQAYCAVDQPDDEHRRGDLVVTYANGKKGYEETAKHLAPMMPDVREGTPRGSFKGVVTVRCRGRRLFLKPA